MGSDPRGKALRSRPPGFAKTTPLTRRPLGGTVPRFDTTGGSGLVAQHIRRFGPIAFFLALLGGLLGVIAPSIRQAMASPAPATPLPIVEASAPASEDVCPAEMEAEGIYPCAGPATATRLSVSRRIPRPLRRLRSPGRRRRPRVASPPPRVATAALSSPRAGTRRAVASTPTRGSFTGRSLCRPTTFRARASARASGSSIGVRPTSTA